MGQGRGDGKGGGSKASSFSQTVGRVCCTDLAACEAEALVKPHVLQALGLVTGPATAQLLCLPVAELLENSFKIIQTTSA